MWSISGAALVRVHKVQNSTSAQPWKCSSLCCNVYPPRCQIAVWSLSHLTRQDQQAIFSAGDNSPVDSPPQWTAQRSAGLCFCGRRMQVAVGECCRQGQSAISLVPRRPNLQNQCRYIYLAQTLHNGSFQSEGFRQNSETRNVALSVLNHLLS